MQVSCRQLTWCVSPKVSAEPQSDWWYVDAVIHIKGTKTRYWVDCIVLYSTWIFLTLFFLLNQTICIWGAGGATPGKFLLGLRVVTCDTSTMVRPNRIFVVPASNVSLSAWVIKFFFFYINVDILNIWNWEVQVTFFFFKTNFLHSQLHCASVEQELLHRFSLSCLHHAPLLPAQQDSLRHCGRDHSGPTQRGLKGCPLNPNLLFLRLGHCCMSKSDCSVFHQDSPNLFYIKILLHWKE